MSPYLNGSFGDTLDHATWTVLHVHCGCSLLPQRGATGRVCREEGGGGSTMPQHQLDCLCSTPGRAHHSSKFSFLKNAGQPGSYGGLQRCPRIKHKLSSPCLINAAGLCGSEITVFFGGLFFFFFFFFVNAGAGRHICLAIICGDTVPGSLFIHTTAGAEWRECAVPRGCVHDRHQ